MNLWEITQLGKKGGQKQINISNQKYNFFKHKTYKNEHTY